MVERVFRLQGSPNLRHLQEKQVKENLATANADLDQADQKLKTARSWLGNMTATNGSNLAVAAAMRSTARIQIQEGITRKEYAEAVVEQRQQEWRSAKQLAATLEKLGNCHNEAVLADDLHEEQIVLGEIASQRDNALNITDGARTKLRHEEVETVREHQRAWMK